jgi:hypothetical protein
MGDASFGVGLLGGVVHAADGLCSSRSYCLSIMGHNFIFSIG